MHHVTKYAPMRALKTSSHVCDESTRPRLAKTRWSKQGLDRHRGSDALITDWPLSLDISPHSILRRSGGNLDGHPSLSLTGLVLSLSGLSHFPKQPPDWPHSLTCDPKPRYITAPEQPSMARTNRPWLSLFCLCLVGLAVAHGFSHRPQDTDEHQPFVMPEELSEPDEESTGSFWGPANNLHRDGAVLEIVMAPKPLQYQSREGAWAGRRGGAPATEATSPSTAAKVTRSDPAELLLMLKAVSVSICVLYAPVLLSGHVWHF